ncbi:MULTISPECIES: WXG100 family type VII secretion target [Streptomyces]|uniref:WXG100 family type VII secretion target n=1 Tax=Streptomyces TaxID=1883 RepID=UPI0006B03375|nr:MULTISPECIES: WXG100 family type VII secretion target [Streptomyces]MCI4081768.1 WXG100 family type VII secretion target [Streptomyces sp. MMS21 TC-5]
MSGFESYTHAQLYAMIAALDDEVVSAQGTQLTEAAKTIKEIGTNLKNHKVKGWEGEAAEAFQNWVNQAGNATLVLADYSEAGGKYLTQTAQVMREVKPKNGTGDMPKYSASAEASLKEDLATSREYHNDPDAVQLGQQAWSKLSGDHARAVDAMNKLSGSYEQSSTQMDKATIPTFPPPPQVFVPIDHTGGEDMARPGGNQSAYGGGAGSGGSSYAPSGDSGRVGSGDPGPVGHLPDNSVPSVPAPSTPDREVDVDLDTVGTLPPPTTPPATTPPGLPPTTGPLAPTPGPFVPPATVPPVGGLKGPGPFGTPPGLGPYPGTGGPGVPGGKVIGTPGLPPRDAGITGGRPVTSTGPTSGIPRGTVIGEGGQAGRPMGGGMGHGAGGHYGGTQAGLPAGRRLATEPGGVMGGRQAGAIGRPIAAGQPFTQGGSGLVRNGAGPVGHGGTQTPGRRRDNQGSERPDYLTEDEETWQGTRRVAPPVID